MFKKRLPNFLFFYTYLGNKMLIALFLSFSVGLLDGLGLAMFIPLLQMVGGTSGSSSEKVVSEGMGNFDVFLNFLTSIGIPLNLVSVMLIILFFFLMKGIAKFCESYYNVVLTTNFVKRIRIEAVNSISSINYGYFISLDSGRIQNTLSGEIERLQQAFRYYSSSVQSIISVLVYMALAFLTNPQFALFVAIGGGLSNLLYTKLYTKTKDTSKKITNANHVFHGLMMQQVHNFKYLRATGQVDAFSLRLKKTITSLAINFRKIGFFNSVLLSTKEPLSITVVVVVILVQVSYFKSDLGPIILSLMFFYRSLNQLINYQNSWNGFLNYSGSLNNFKEFVEELKANKLDYNVGERISNIESIELENVSFSYDHRKFLQQINLVIEKNKTVAFVGESGSGKTTLTNILTGLLFADSGTLLVNGMDIKNSNLNNFQARIGYITQEPVIFSDSLFNNITFWSEKTPKNFEKFKESVNLASLTSFLDGLEKGEDTPLGNNGIMVSGGQKQRIAIAREIYKDVDLLVMDEATSALDTATEKEIQESFEKLKGKFTLIIIAHRLSTIKSADTIYFLNKGQIEYSGDFYSLQNESREFKNMVELQGVS
ncbi:ABC transporter ATP-binding protein/permease [Aquiflexum sp. TKW24L]|uniref:ABC transporter ATP-binding protein n=1 Tax=Aquiflexum sp. TKW24L TaxID=2942212 RepID=UPI0020BF2794|nr:ABC transporter ATP-binding protein [Aquiflexum sp. TKW24L]MCL6260782.1 ABC transporter ATP-binding protein/permease [Aquiflexum sp. TKW24L]